MDEHLSDIAISEMMDRLEASIESIGREREEELKRALPDWPKPPPEEPNPPTKQIVSGPYGPTEKTPPPPGLVDHPSHGRPYVEPALPPRRGGGGGGKPRVTTFRPKLPSFKGKRLFINPPQCQAQDGCSTCNRGDNCPFKADREERNNQ
jgi:hypothetical protein